MDKVEMVCVACHKVDPGTGVWSTDSGAPASNRKESLCPDCCYHRFPHFYSDFKAHDKHRPGLKGVFSSVASFLKS